LRRLLSFLITSSLLPFTLRILNLDLSPVKISASPKTFLKISTISLLAFPSLAGLLILTSTAFLHYNSFEPGKTSSLIKTPSLLSFTASSSISENSIFCLLILFS